jgi:hypothetical protein
MWRVELFPGTVERAEKIAADTGYSLADIFCLALTDVSDERWARRRAILLR